MENAKMGEECKLKKNLSYSEYFWINHLHKFFIKIIWGWEEEMDDEVRSAIKDNC